MIVRWTDEALENLWEIETWIGRNNPEKAEIFINALIEKGELISMNPHMGRIVPEFSSQEIRELIIKNYRMVYRLDKEEVVIITVFEGHKVIPAVEVDQSDSSSQRNPLC
jgi:addiction module RelE/StbE family toxin